MRAHRAPCVGPTTAGGCRVVIVRTVLTPFGPRPGCMHHRIGPQCVVTVDDVPEPGPAARRGPKCSRRSARILQGSRRTLMKGGWTASRSEMQARHCTRRVAVGLDQVGWPDSSVCPAGLPGADAGMRASITPPPMSSKRPQTCSLSAPAYRARVVGTMRRSTYWTGSSCGDGRRRAAVHVEEERAVGARRCR